MSTFTLAISCLTTSNLPWFIDLTFQVPIQYCSLQHWTLILPSVTSTAGYCFSFGSIPSFFLDLFLHWPPVAYWVPTDLGSTTSPVLYISRQVTWPIHSHFDTELKTRVQKQNLNLGFYAILLFTALAFASITSHVHSWVLFLLCLHLIIYI